jgi:hypothetical protein
MASRRSKGPFRLSLCAKISFLLLLSIAGASVAIDKTSYTKPHDDGESSDAPARSRTPTESQMRWIEKRLATLNSGSECRSDFADSFADEDGNSTDYAGYVAACLRVEAGVARYGEAGYHLNRGTGLEPEQMRFEINDDDSEDVLFARAYPSRTCSGDRTLASIQRANVCYSASGARSLKLVNKLPRNCLILIYLNTPDCTGESMVYGVPDSELQCYTGMSFESIKLVCASLEVPAAMGNETCNARNK